MKEHIYPDDIKAVPIKRIGPEEQEPFVKLEIERHGLWRELVALEEEGFRLGTQVEIPLLLLSKRFFEEHPEIRHLAILKLPTSHVAFEESAYDADLRGAKAKGAEIQVRRKVVARVGAMVARQEEVAGTLALLLSALPTTLAQSQIEVPREEAGWLALARYFAEQEAAVRRRQERIDEIQREIDRLAWALYSPKPN